MRTAMSRWGGIVVAIGGLISFTGVARGTPILQQVNNFEAGNQGWTNGGGATDPVNVTSGGPAGTDDNFLRVNARGGGGAGSRLTVYSRASQWAGNYVTAGVNRVEMDLKNLGASPLTMRIAFQESGGSRYASTAGFALPADGLWHHAGFGIDAASLIRAGGSTAIATGLTRITEFRVIHSVAADFMGDPINASFGVDNIRALPEPGSVAVVALAGAAVLLRRRR